MIVAASSGADSRHSGKALMQGTVVIFLLHLSWSASCIWHAKRHQQLEVQWMLFTQSWQQRHSWPYSRTAVAGAHSSSGWSRQAYYWVRWCGQWQETNKGCLCTMSSSPEMENDVGNKLFQLKDSPERFSVIPVIEENISSCETVKGTGRFMF